MRKKLLISLLIMGMMMQSLTIPALAAPSDVYSEAEENVDDSLLLPEETSSILPEKTEDTPAETMEESPANEETASLEPTQIPEETPEAIPEVTPESSSEVTPETTPEATPEATPEGEEQESIAALSSQEDEEEKCEQLSGQFVYQEGAVDAVTKIRETDQDDVPLDKAAAVDWTTVYEYVYQQLKAKKSEITLSQYKITYGDDALWLVTNVVNEHPDLYFVNAGKSLIYYNSSNIVTKIEAEYYSGYDNAAFATAVEDALSTVSDSMSDLEKAITLHDYLVLNCAYFTAGCSSTVNSYSAYSALVDGAAVCQGYALAYKYLLNKAGIECYMVTSNSMNHAWNLIKIDGYYYHVDVTWDDPIQDRLGYVWHNNMLVSDTEFQTNKGHHDWVINSNGKALDLKAEDTGYDDAFWVSVRSPLIINGDSMYYLNRDEMALKERNLTDGSEKDVYDQFSIWPTTVESPYAFSTMSGLFMIGDRLYFNDPDYICSVKTDGSGFRQETEKLSTAEGYVYGCAYCKGVVKYVLYGQYDFESKETPLTVELQSGEDIAVSKIVLSQSEAVLGRGEEITLTAKVYPSYAQDQELSWESSDESVATVINGTVKAVESGECDITVSAGGVSAVCKIKVRRKLSVPVFSPAAGTIDLGDKVEITALEGAAIYYTVDGSDPSSSPGKKTKEYTEPIAIDKDMTIKALAVMKDADNSDIATAVYKACTNNLILDKNEVTLTEGEQADLLVKELPTTRTGEDVMWNSSDPSVVSVDKTSGKLTAVFEGSATVTATVKDHKGREVSANCKVTVEPPVYTVRFFGSKNAGPIDTQSVKARRDAALPAKDSFTAPEGYEFAGWQGDYTNIRKDTDIYAKYNLITYTISYKLNGGSFTTEKPVSYNVETPGFALPIPERDGYLFVGWYTDDSLEGNSVSVIEKGSVGNKTFFAKWKDERGLRMRAEGAQEDNVIPNQQYTGKALKPGITVFYGDTPLKEGTDYTISYQNNTKANLLKTEAELKKQPTVLIKGKGNYAGTITATFVIEKKDLEDADIQIDNLAAAYNKGKAIKPVPTVKWNGKKLTNKKDFVVEYPDSLTDENAYKQPGVYTVLVKEAEGGNFEGKREITLTITDPVKEERLISKAKVSRIPDQPYDGTRVELSQDMLKITYGKDSLVLGTDYCLKYEESDNYTDIGTHEVLIVGKDKYCGERRVTFKITGQSVKNLKIRMPELIYDGTDQEPEINPETAFAEGADPATFKDTLIITDKLGNPVNPEGNYTLRFEKNRNAGTAKMTLTGTGYYTGSVSKTFKIKSYSLTEGSEGITAEFANGSRNQIYEKGGAKPKVTVTFGGEVLTEGVDYTLSYANNTSVVQKAGKEPTVTIKGKNNFTGSRKLTFIIDKQDISTVSITVPDMEVNAKPGKFFGKPVLTDVNGKRLSSGTDYETTFVYRDENGKELGKTDRPLSGAVIKITVKGKGSYEGEVTGTFRIIAKGMNISRAKVIVKSKLYYTGEKITLSKGDLEVKMGAITLESDQYEILEDSYVNNLKQGTAKVTIKGKGEYGGTKTISFKINAQSMAWWKKNSE